MFQVSQMRKSLKLIEWKTILDLRTQKKKKIPILYAGISHVLKDAIIRHFKDYTNSYKLLGEEN